MKVVPRGKTIYSFGPKHKPAARVGPGELVLLKTEDAFGGQIRSEEDTAERLD
jgi:amidase